MEDGFSVDSIFEYTNIDPWFLNQLAELHQAEQWLKSKKLADISKEDLIQAKRRGFSDIQIATTTGASPGLILPALRGSSFGVSMREAHQPLF